VRARNEGCGSGSSLTRVRVPIGDEIRYWKVVRRKRDLDGTARGRSNSNSMLDTRTYEIEFPDGRSDEYTANVIE
jgi:hypothetical protein